MIAETPSQPGAPTPPVGAPAHPLRGLDDLRRDSGEWVRSARLFVTAFGVLVSASYLAFVFVRPRWDAPGYPSYYGYGKNVEQAAFLLTVLGALAAGAAHSLRRGVGFSFLVWMATVLALVKDYYEGRRESAVLLAMVAAFALYFAWYDRGRDRVEAGPGPSRPGRRAALASAAAMAIASAWVFLSTCGPVPRLDLHHQGEVVGSALDYLGGGVPFRTYFWPHGASDTVLAVLFMEATGNRGLGAYVLAWATHNVLGLLALFALARGLIGGTLQATLAAILIAVSCILWSYWVGNHVASVACLLLLSRTTNRAALVGIGGLLGFGFLWRIDSGVFALAASAAYLGFEHYYVRGYALGGPMWRHLLDGRRLAGLAGDLAAVALGAGLCWGISRAAFGFPNAEWFRVALVELPRYHRDSTGFPLPLALRGVQNIGWLGSLREEWTLLFVVGCPATLLLALGMLTFTWSKAVGRRLPVAQPRDRFFLLMAIYGVLSLKTILNRSEGYHQLAGSIILVSLVAFDALEAIRRRARPPLVAAATAAVCLGTGLFLATCFPPVKYPGPTVPRASHLAALRAALRPAETDEAMLSPTTDPELGEILKGVEQVRGLLDAEGVGPRALLVYHSAPFLYPLLDREPPTKYYCLGWAASPSMERELIARLGRNRVRAFLHVNGVGQSIVQYDIPDRERIPLVHRYIEDREARGRTFETNLGTLTIVDDPTAPGD